MKRWYMIARAVGYAAGLLGLILFTLGRQDANPFRLKVGGGLLVVGFLAFFCSYVLFVAIRMQRRSCALREPPKQNGP